VPRLVIGSALALALLVTAGCGAISRSGGPGIAVVASTTQLGDIVRNVGGPAVSVRQILRPNTDPHEYEPRPADIIATARAQLVVVSGDGLDHWMGRVLDSAGGRPTVLDAGAGRPVTRAGDPHWWHDPRNVEFAVRRIGAALQRVEPGAAAAIRRSTRAYLARLRRLDAGISRCLRSVPAGRRKLVTDHDAFGYFARRYAITVVGAVIPAQTTEAQASARDLSSLSALIRREHVRAVFPESSISPRLAKTIARQTGASANDTLYGDTLGPKGSPGATYLGMEAANADAMTRGFTGGARGCRIRF
jgi:ABC-type Zn uptake system ZnuABC Zn-binding protein ZnuA